MKRWRPARVVVVCLAVALFGVMASADYSGSLQYDTGLNATANWADADWPTAISWVVSPNPNGSYHYSYTLSTPGPDISHFIIELTDPVNEGDLFNITGGTEEIGLHQTASGNPNMPEDVYGIKLQINNTVANVEFDSWRLPVWQDFYAKCGATTGEFNTVWNIGFTSSDSDPTDAPADGSIDNHILAPNGYVPEPATTALFGIGLAGLIGARFRRRRED